MYSIYSYIINFISYWGKIRSSMVWK